MITPSVLVVISEYCSPLGHTAPESQLWALVSFSEVKVEVKIVCMYVCMYA